MSSWATATYLFIYLPSIIIITPQIFTSTCPTTVLFIAGWLLYRQHRNYPPPITISRSNARVLKYLFLEQESATRFLLKVAGIPYLSLDLQQYEVVDAQRWHGAGIDRDFGRYISSLVFQHYCVGLPRLVY